MTDLFFFPDKPPGLTGSTSHRQPGHGGVQNRSRRRAESVTAACRLGHGGHGPLLWLPATGCNSCLGCRQQTDGATRSSRFAHSEQLEGSALSGGAARLVTLPSGCRVERWGADRGEGGTAPVHSSPTDGNAGWERRMGTTDGNAICSASARRAASGQRGRTRRRSCPLKTRNRTISGRRSGGPPLSGTQALERTAVRSTRPVGLEQARPPGRLAAAVAASACVREGRGGGGGGASRRVHPAGDGWPCPP